MLQGFCFLRTGSLNVIQKLPADNDACTGFSVHTLYFGYLTRKNR